jgi:hypothetical protein
MFEKHRPICLELCSDCSEELFIPDVEFIEAALFLRRQDESNAVSIARQIPKTLEKPYSVFDAASVIWVLNMEKPFCQVSMARARSGL